MSGFRIPAQYITKGAGRTVITECSGQKKRKIVQIVEKTEYF